MYLLLLATVACSKTVLQTLIGRTDFYHYTCTWLMTAGKSRTAAQWTVARQSVVAQWSNTKVDTSSVTKTP